MVRADILRRAKRQAAPCNTLLNPWMVNGQGLDPCRQVEHLCTSGPPITLGTLSGNLTCPSGNDPQGCCCSVATYALLSACWVCQGHNPVDIDIDIQPSYIDFFHNSGCPVSNFSGTQPQPNGPDIPQWALILPNNLRNHWNFTEARIYGLENATTTSFSSPVMSPASSTAPAGNPLPVSHNTSTSPGTIAGAVLGSLSLTSLISVRAWFVWRRRRRRVNRPNKGAKVDLIEPEMEGPSRVTDVTSGTADALRRVSTFPFPYEGITPRYYPNAPRSLEPSGTDAGTPPDSGRDSRTSRRQTAPVTIMRLPMDQLDRDLARLQGVDVSSNSQVNESHLGEGKGQMHHPYIHKTQRKRAVSITTFTPSSNSGSANSRRARRKSSGGEASRGRYFHVPPSAQYLANVARYPEKVDPERPWDIRRDGGTS